MTRRYLFLCPDRTSASGGIAVIYDMVALLTRTGRAAAVVHNGPMAGYPDHPEAVPTFFTDRIRKAEWRWMGPRQKVDRIGQWAGERMRPARLRPVDPRPGDVIVAPEFMLAETLEAFAGWPIVVLVQNPFEMMVAHDRAVTRGFDPAAAVMAWCHIADVCQRHLEMLGARNVLYFPVSMKPHEFPFRAEKADLITYMPRKRPREARIIDRALRVHGALGGYRLEAMDGLPRAKIAEKLGESRIFISLLKEEALGFPAAEAMAAGCIVVGFDGLGCAEYFDDTTGVPVTEGDVAGLVAAVEAVIAEHGRDPVRLDDLRRRASETVNARYSVEAFERGVMAAWQQIERGLDGGRG